MRVLHFIPDIGVSNGVMSVILNYAKAMPSDIKFDVVYFHETQQTRRADIEALGGKVYKINRPSPKNIIIADKELNTLFSEHGNDWSALHIHAPHFAVFIAPYAKRHGISKIAVHCHSSVYSLKGNRKVNELLSLYAEYFVKDKFACSEDSGKFWYKGKSFNVLHNAVDCAKYQYDEKARNDVRKSLDLKNEFVVGHIGRTDIPQKNHKFLFEIFSLIHKENPQSALLLIGGEANEECTALCRKLNIGNSVKFLGMRNDVPQLLQACDAFVFPSISEGLPVSVIEAQAAGLPVILSDCVTDEAVATENVVKLSLNESALTWANTAVRSAFVKRTDTYKNLCDAGWDINDCAEQLVEYYRK